MKTISIDQSVNLPLLTEELFDAFPEWRRPDPMGRGFAVTSAVITPEEITFPDETDEQDVLKVIRKHDEAKDSRNQAKEKRRAIKRESARNKLQALGLDSEEIEVLGI